MVRRLHQTMADYVVIAISPALIMALVGSLIFFLLEVFYQGEFPQRLYWVMGCFVFAAVLIGRISIEEGFERAAPFGATLAVLVAIASNRFMQYQGGWIEHVGFLINWGLIALTWWCAHRLTWDCTVIDDDQDASGEGLLQVAGLEKPAADAQRKTDPELPLEGTTSRAAPASIWQRYVQHQRRPHAPGVWVVYFSLAALPLFGIGQWFIPVTDTTGRRVAFWLLAVYVAAGTGLLLTTSFLGLRRYLRQRRIEMPTLMANLWMGTGALIIVLLLVLTAMLPRPSAEYAISELPFRLGSPDQQGSRHAPIAREGAKNQQQAGPAPQETDDDNATSTEPAEPRGGPGAEASTSQSGTSSSPEGKQAGDSRQSSGSADTQGQGKDGQTGDQGQQASDQGDSLQATSGRDQPRPANSMRGESLSKSDSSTEATHKPPRRDDAIQQRESQEEPDSTNQQRPDDGRPSPDDRQFGDSVRAFEAGAETAASGLVELFKWVLYGALVLAAGYFSWRFRAEVAKAVRDFVRELRDLLSGLFGRRRRGALPAPEELVITVLPPPFASFVDPFATGVAGRYSLSELVRYSFEAFEAWSREHDCQRPPDRTPHELARSVARRHAYIKAEATHLAELYARAAYARGELPETTREQLQSLWRKMRQASIPSPPI